VAPDKVSGESKTDPELKSKALLLLAETSQQARGLKRRENQVAIRIELAELIWNEQEHSARQLYREAFDILRAPSKEMPQSELSSPRSFRSPFQLRTRLIESLGQHDPVLARELLRQTTIKKDEEIGSKDEVGDADVNPQPDYEMQRMDMNLTAAIAEKNPEEAKRAAQEALKAGSFSTALSLMMKLSESNHGVAQELVTELVAELKKADFKKDHNAIEAASLLIREEMGSKSSSNNQNQSGNPQPPRQSLMDPETLRGFVEFLVDTALRKDFGEYLLMNLREMDQELQAIAPAQAARVQQKWAELEKEYPQLRELNRYRETKGLGNTQQLLQAAQNAPPGQRDTIYLEAATVAFDQGDKKLTSEIVKKISNANERKAAVDTFRDRTISEYLRDGEFAEARRLIAQTAEADNRVRQLLDLAAAQAAKDDKHAAMEILNELQTSLPAKPRNGADLNLQIRLSQAFAMADPDRGFALLSTTMDEINELVEATARVANFVSFGAEIKDNEFDVGSPSGIPGIETLLSRDIKAFAVADFARTRTLLDRLQRPEIRLTAYLDLSRSILEPERDCSCSCPTPVKKQNK